MKGFQAASAGCGRSSITPHFARIVGGHAAVPGSWPWMVQLNEDGYQECGGALIHPYWVVTASHCFEERRDRDPRIWDAYAGKFHMSTHDSTEQKVKVKDIIMHPSYDIPTKVNDIALVLLEQPIHYNSHVQPICLSDGGGVHKDEVCVVAGWGVTRGTGDPTVLNQVKIPVLGDDMCARSDWYGDEFLPRTMICAGYEKGVHDSCQGDSGGPLMCKRNGVYHLMGVTSWGIDCAKPKQPGVYCDASLYTNWINETTRRHGHSIG